MFSKEFLDVLIQLLKSWQVIAVSIGLIFYFSIVSYVARSYHRPRVKRVKRIKVKKAAPVQEVVPEESESGGNANDELGLSED